MRDENDKWIDALAGRGNGPSASATDVEGSSLRAALLAREPEPVSPVPDVDADREAALISRAVAAGMLPKPTPQPIPGVRAGVRPARWYARRPASLAAVAVIACIVVGVVLQTRTQPPVQVLRGASDHVVHLRAQDPLRLKQDLLRELRAAGIRANGYETFGRQGIDADLPTPVSAEARSVLERHGISVPRDNILQVEIEPDAIP